MLRIVLFRAPHSLASLMLCIASIRSFREWCAYVVRNTSGVFPMRDAPTWTGTRSRASQVPKVWRSECRVSASRFRP